MGSDGTMHGKGDESVAFEDAETSTGLDRRASRLLAYLKDHAGQIVSQQELMNHIWPGQIVHQNSLHQAIVRVRKAIEHEGSLIEAIYGQGYRLNLNEGVLQENAKTASRPRAHWLALASGVVLLCAVVAYNLFNGWAFATSEDERAEAVAIDYLSDDLLNKADPYAGKDYDPAVRPIVERVIADADKRFAKEPAILVKLHYRFGSVLSGWGKHARGDFHMNKSAEIAEGLYGRESPDYVNARVAQCEIERLGGDLPAAIAHCNEGLALSKRIGNVLLQRKAQLAQAKLDFENGRYRDARTLLSPIVEKQERQEAKLDDDTLANANWFYALSSRKLADYRNAETGFKRLVAIRLKQKGPNHPHTAWALSDYGDFLVDIGRYDEARKMLEDAKRIFFATLGPEHPDSYSPGYSLALIELNQGRPQEAAKEFARLDKGFTESLGSEHLWTLYTRTQLALSLAEAGEQAQARKLVDQIRPVVREQLYGKVEKLSYFQMCWAETLLSLHDYAGALDEARAAKYNLERSLGPNHPWMKRINAVLNTASPTLHGV